MYTKHYGYLGSLRDDESDRLCLVSNKFYGIAIYGNISMLKLSIKINWNLRQKFVDFLILLKVPCIVPSYFHILFSNILFSVCIYNIYIIQ